MANKTDYRRLYVQMWRDREVRRWGAEAKLLFVYLITNESTENCGAYQIMIEDMARETGIPEGRIAPLLAELDPAVRWWPELDHVFVPRLYQYQHGPNDNPNFRKSAVKSMAGLPPVVAAAVVAEYPELADGAAIVTSGDRRRGGGGAASPLEDVPSPFVIVKGVPRAVEPSRTLPSPPRVMEFGPFPASDSPPEPSRDLETPSEPLRALSSPLEPSRPIPIPIPKSIPTPNENAPAPVAPTPLANARNGKADFEAFLAAYPKVGNPLEAQAAWKEVAAAGEIPPIDRVLATLEGHKSSSKWAENDGQYIPRASKYIRDRRWNMKPVNEVPRPRGGSSPDMPQVGKAVY